MKKLLPLAVAALLFGAGCTTDLGMNATSTDSGTTSTNTGGQGSTTSTSGSTTTSTNSGQGSTTSTTSTSESNAANWISMNSQKPGSAVTVNFVRLSAPGFVSIHEDVNGTPGKVLGTSAFLNAGETRDVPITAKVGTGKNYWAMLHVDDGNGRYTTEQADMPVKDASGAIVMKRFNITGVGTNTSSTSSSTSTGSNTNSSGNSSNASSTSNTTNNGSMNSSSTSANIQGFAFVPSVITVSRGATVTFTNSDAVAHTVTSDGGYFDSGYIAQNGSYPLNTANLSIGVYPFHCTPHPNMKGTLIVQ